jgi:hypothetical protein
MTDTDRIRHERYGRLPGTPAPDDWSVDVPSFADDRPAPPPTPPAAAPELGAATSVADGSGGPRTIPRPGLRAGLFIIGGALVAVVAIGGLVQLASLLA